MCQTQDHKTIYAKVHVGGWDFELVILVNPRPSYFHKKRKKKINATSLPFWGLFNSGVFGNLEPRTPPVRESFLVAATEENQTFFFLNYHFGLVKSTWPDRYDEPKNRKKKKKKEKKLMFTAEKSKSLI